MLGKLVICLGTDNIRDNGMFNNILNCICDSL